MSAIYTFGAPATATPSLRNPLSTDGCFTGLRCYNEDVLGPATIQVDAAAISNLHKHARMNTVVLHSGKDSIYAPCPGHTETSWPSDDHGDVFAEWSLHWENDYTPRLKNVTVAGTPFIQDEPFRSAYLFLLLAFKTYDTTEHTRQQMVARMPDWKLVARETRIQGSGTTYDEDPVMIAQNTETLDCAIVFSGTNNADNEIATSTTTYGAKYCGMSGIHDGYRNELWDIARDLMPKLRLTLSKCNTVSCVGHNMGGSLCEIFAACANSKNVGDPDYQQQMWAMGTPEALPEIVQGGVVYTHGAEHRCEEPPCPDAR